MEKMKLAARLRVLLIALAVPTCTMVLHGVAIDWHATAEQSCRERRNGGWHPPKFAVQIKGRSRQKLPSVHATPA